jgi:DNA-binding NarL/FixJ family response regulator
MSSLKVSKEEDTLIEEDTWKNELSDVKEVMPPESFLDTLTPREREVFQYLLKGYMVPQIAEILNIKYYTAKVHVKKIYEKLDVGSRPELFVKYGPSVSRSIEDI